MKCPLCHNQHIEEIAEPDDGTCIFMCYTCGNKSQWLWTLVFILIKAPYRMSA